MSRAFLAYATANVAFFAFGVHILKIREMALYLFVIAVGFPASLCVVPASEYVASAVGWSLGSMPHVWASDLAACLVNCVIFLLVVRTDAAIRRRSAG